MEKWQRDQIKSNLMVLVKETKCNALFLTALTDADVLYEGDTEEINVHRNKYDKNSEFYSIIQLKVNAYQPLINALRETNQEALALLLEKGVPGGGASNPATAPRNVTGGLSVPTVNILPATPPVQSVAPIAMGKPTWDGASGQAPPMPDEDEVDFLNNVNPLTISVRKPMGRMAFPDDHYGLREDFKGYALVLNITQFQDPKRNRAGAQKDTVYMANLWTALGYKVSQHEGSFTFQEVQTILDTFLNQFKQDPSGSAPSCVVFIGSHGSFSKIEASDHRSINLYADVIYKFDSSQCPQLLGKPKIFIIQACQRFQTDSVPNRTEADAMLQTPIDDTIICFSTIPGYVANRDVYLGTWYTYCLTKVFMEGAHDTHLLGLLKRVQETMRNINADADQGQLSAYLDLGIKTLYFNM